MIRRFLCFIGLCDDWKKDRKMYQAHAKKLLAGPDGKAMWNSFPVEPTAIMLRDMLKSFVLEQPVLNSETERLVCSILMYRNHMEEYADFLVEKVGLRRPPHTPSCAAWKKGVRHADWYGSLEEKQYVQRAHALKQAMRFGRLGDRCGPRHIRPYSYLAFCIAETCATDKHAYDVIDVISRIDNDIGRIRVTKGWTGEGSIWGPNRLSSTSKKKSRFDRLLAEVRKIRHQTARELVYPVSGSPSQHVSSHLTRVSAKA